MQRPFPLRQGGAALLIVLIILVLVTLMGLTTMKASVLQEKMSGGNADKTLAFQAAELALRDAERYIDASLTSASGFVDGCSRGLCLPVKDGSFVLENFDWAGKALRYGAETGSAALGGVAHQPQYFIELLPDMAPPLGDTVRAATTGTPYRITAIGYGRQSATRVILQSTFYKP